MFRLVHLSDPHIGLLPRLTPRQLASKRITGYVNWRMTRRRNHGSGALTAILDDVADQQPSHICVSGDLIHISLDSEIDAAREWLAILGEPRDVSVVPGNHDAYVPGAFDRVCRQWRPWMEGDPPSVGPDQFPYLRIRGDIAVIGVNSARATAPFMATGYFRHKQALALTAILNETKRAGLCRIVMIHHPPVYRAIAFHKRLVGISRFQRVIRECGAEAVLHGHTHLPTLNWIGGPDEKVPVIGVAAAGQAPGGLRPAAQYNILEIDRADDGWHIALTRRGLGDGRQGIGRISKQSLTSGDRIRSDAELRHQV